MLIGNTVQSGCEQLPCYHVSKSARSQEHVLASMAVFLCFVLLFCFVLVFFGGVQKVAQPGDNTALLSAYDYAILQLCLCH